MIQKAQLMDEATLGRALKRISHEICEKNRGVENVVLIGILRRGYTIAQIIEKNIGSIENTAVPCGSMDICGFRDDLVADPAEQVSCKVDLPFNVKDKDVILVDDVLCSGRTVRAAIEAVFRCGRPRTIQLAVLIDRGHRELPFRADYVGKNIPTSRSESIEVRLPDYDGETGVYLMETEK